MASYRNAVEWIARNDAPGDEYDAETLADTLTVVLVADLFGREPAKVAQDVVSFRKIVMAREEQDASETS